MIYNKTISFMVVISKINYLNIKGTAQNKIFQKVYLRNVNLNT